MLLRHFLKINVITRVLFGCGIMTSCVDRENAWNPRRFIGPNPRKARGLCTPRGRRVEFTVYRGYSTTGITHGRYPDFRHGKKNRNGANLKLRHTLRVGGVINKSATFGKHFSFDLLNFLDFEGALPSFSNSYQLPKQAVH